MARRSRRSLPSVDTPTQNIHADGWVCPPSVEDFSEIKVVDPTISYYTINGLKQFTQYEFFITPYFKIVDGVPSNILSAETNEGRPSVAPPNLSVRQLNETSVTLSWFGVPRSYANGIVRGYRIFMNQTDYQSPVATSATTSGNRTSSHQTNNNYYYQARSIDLPLNSLRLQLVPMRSNLDALQQQQQQQKINSNNNQKSVMVDNNHQQQPMQMLISYDLTNLTHLTQLYSFKVTAYTIAGHGPYSDSVNIILDLASNLNTKNLYSDNMMFMDSGNSQLLPPDKPSDGSFHQRQPQANSGAMWMLVVSSGLIIVLIALVGVYLLLVKRFRFNRNHHRNNQMISWKQMLSSQLSQKFYHHQTMSNQYNNNNNNNNSLPTTEHTLVTTAGHTLAEPITGATGTSGPSMWLPNGALLTPNGAMVNQAIMSIMPLANIQQTGNGVNGNNLADNDNNMHSQLGKTSINHLVTGNTIGGAGAGNNIHVRYNNNKSASYKQETASEIYPQPLISGDYYSIVNVAEYEELDGTMRTKTTTATNMNGSNSRTGSQQQVEFNSPLSSNSTSDTNSNSCPTSVTRLIPMVSNSGSSTISKKLSSFGQQHQLMSPYATTNLIIMDQQQQQQQHQQMSQQPGMDLTGLQQQQQFILHQQQLQHQQQHGAVITGNQTYNQLGDISSSMHHLQHQQQQQAFLQQQYQNNNNLPSAAMQMRHKLIGPHIDDYNDQQQQLGKMMMSITNNPLDRQQQQHQHQDDNNFYEQIDYEQAFPSINQSHNMLTAANGNPTKSNMARLITGYNHQNSVAQQHHQLHHRMTSNTSVSSPSAGSSSYAPALNAQQQLSSPTSTTHMSDMGAFNSTNNSLLNYANQSTQAQQQQQKSPSNNNNNNSSDVTLAHNTENSQKNKSIETNEDHHRQQPERGDSRRRSTKRQKNNN